MSQKRWVLCAATVASALVAACGSDATGVTPPESGNPSQAQVSSMSSALTALLEYSYEGESEPNSIHKSIRMDAVARQLRSERAPYQGGIHCAEGGRTGVRGTYSLTQTDEVIEVTDTLVDCGMRDGHGLVWHFNSTPAVTSSIDIKMLDSIDFERTQTDAGRIQYTNGSLSGTCTINVAIADHITFATEVTRASTLRIRTQGTICGRAVDGDTLIVTPWPD
jgi:hypothetical protein